MIEKCCGTCRWVCVTLADNGDKYLTCVNEVGYECGKRIKYDDADCYEWEDCVTIYPPEPLNFCPKCGTKYAPAMISALEVMRLAYLDMVNIITELDAKNREGNE